MYILQGNIFLKMDAVTLFSFSKVSEHIQNLQDFKHGHIF